MKKTTASYCMKTTQVEQLQREAEKAQRIIDQINMMEDVLWRMKEENNWMNYLGEESGTRLTDDERSKVYAFHSFIQRSTDPANRRMRLDEFLGNTTLSGADDKAE